MASEFEWAESAEVTLLTEVEIQSQLNFCHCSHRAEVTSPSLEYSALLAKDRVSLLSGTNLTCGKATGPKPSALNVSKQFQTYKLHHPSCQ